jgi:hypothetical protein
MAYPTPLHDASGALLGAVNMLLDVSGEEDELDANAHSRTKSRRRRKTRASQEQIS